MLIVITQRKLPWQSTLQASVTLSLVNPVLWYLIDRSRPGFALSAIAGVAGTLTLAQLNPDLVPPPVVQHPHEMVTDVPAAGLTVSPFLSQEFLGAWTWVASVLFCSCICFGNIGRKLTPEQ